MKLATFTHGGTTRIGKVVDDKIIDLTKADPTLPTDMISFLAAGDAAMAAAQKASEADAVALSDVTLEAPIMKPGKVMAIGLNYGDHVKEAGLDIPENQIWFTKSPTGCVGEGADVLKPAVSDMVDWEAELVMVIGKRARNVPRDRAHEIVAGYCCGNDISVRDWQFHSPQFTIGKSFDTHGPIGPWLTTSDEVGDPHDLDIKCLVNGEVMQSSNTQHLIFDCFDQIAELTQVMTLEPGDIIFTGTPGGVGIAMKPPQFMKVGDTVTIEIEKLGSITNTLVSEDTKTIIG
ncbi:Fumarylacetoacetate hydrolase family protein [Candidatus Phaeomarinobacter ectocarpi]|uniref:Fumarylacetoacetate hydrolase family protein n=1 Tax=Candidatus Phaeomarinibacter ectocarpi TaxID=1458461 RepID=X5MEA2_9HYPH|nr:fumarylacetoacetate hydrolase family protein [Candidatus Phaeomarinobacter ectocarpi]CDO60792.1 Fumarylacetoacetate hydrolase family protein [Candidatus Phaeomarinobacter ectocarpi]